MKICIFLHSLEAGGGVQQVTEKLIKEFVDMGHRVTLLCPNENVVQKISINSDVYIYSLLKKKDFKMRGFLSLLYPMYLFFKENEDYDIIMCNEVLYSFVCSIALIISNNKVPLVSVSHGTYVFVGGLKQVLVSALSRLFMNISSIRVSAFVGVCDEVVEDLKNILVFKKNKFFYCIYNPVIDNNAFLNKSGANTTKKDLGLENKKIVVSIGRLHHQKGFDILLQSIKYCDDDIVFLIVGEGPEREKLVKLTDELNIKDRVFFQGYQSNIYEYLNIADCFCLCSRWEGFGVVLVEALYANIPIVSFDCPHGPNEILLSGKHGDLVECYDKRSLALSINSKVLVDDNYNTRWEDFTSREIAKSYINVFRTLIKSKINKIR